MGLKCEEKVTKMPFQTPVKRSVLKMGGYWPMTHSHNATPGGRRSVVGLAPSSADKTVLNLNRHKSITVATRTAKTHPALRRTAHSYAQR